MIHNKQILTGLDHSQYEHTLDRAALEKLERIPFLTSACKGVTSNFIERVYNIQYTGSNLKVTKDNYPKIYEYLVEACRILDLQQVPELFMNKILTRKPKNQGLACFIFALVAIAIGGALCLWMGKLSILYVALSVILLVWGVGCWIYGKR